MPMKKKVILIATLIILAGGLLYFNTYSLEEIRVSGCETVDEQIIIDAIEARGFADSTILLYISNKIKPIEEIPFVSKIEIEFISKNVISVTVYEKSMAGCVEYMDGYVYFDKDGIILESSSDKIENVPCIKGLKFYEWEMGKKIPIEDEGKFQSILTITQLIDKYGLEIDGIKFTTENEIILFHEGITIELGEGEYLAIQMMNLGSILEGLQGLEGTLYMKDYNSDDATASFSKK